MTVRRSTYAVTLLIATLLLAGCGSPWKAARKIGKVLMDPDTPVGKTVDQPTQVTMTLLAEPDINPNESGEASPVEIQVLYMSEDSKLLALDYDQLDGKKDVDDLLGKNYIDHQDYTLLPGQYKPLPPLELDAKNRYIGVIAHYGTPNQSEWKKAVRVDGVGQKYSVLVHVRANEVELQKKKDDE